MSEKHKSVCVVGLGYIGLPTASLLGTRGYKVLGIDVSKSVVDTINQGSVHIIEPDLDILVKSAVQSGNLRASLTPEEADVFILAVPTPFKGDHQPDLSYVEKATDSIVSVIRPGNLVILESTSPVGTTTDIVARRLAASGLKIGEQVFVAHCPERVLPGRILTELVENDRIVGGINEASANAAAGFYMEFVRGEVHVTDCARRPSLRNSSRTPTATSTSPLPMSSPSSATSSGSMSGMSLRWRTGIRASRSCSRVRALADTASPSIPGSSSPMRRRKPGSSAPRARSMMRSRTGWSAGSRRRRRSSATR